MSKIEKDAVNRLTAENARLRLALQWALGEGPDPGPLCPPESGQTPGSYPDKMLSVEEKDLEGVYEGIKRWGVYTLAGYKALRREMAATRVLREVSGGK